MSDDYDVVLTGGTVLDPGRGLRTEADIAIRNGRVAAVGSGLGGGTERLLDCTGAVVTPGLIDSHTHIYTNVSKVGAPPDEAHLARGVVAACDAGSAGASTFAGFRRFVAEPARLTVLSFLNVSVLGLIDFRFGELLNADTLVAEDALAVASAHPDIVRGFKIRLSTDVVGKSCLPLLEAAVDVAGRAGLPLMVHIGETAAPLPDILDLLRAGDVVAHCYTGKEHGILDEDSKVLAAVWSARGRGVLFECAHGKSNFSYRVAGPAIEQGFLPDLVCSDTSYRNWNGPVYDLLTTMSKLVALGMALDDVVERATAAPAHFLGLWDQGFGRIEQGQPVRLSVFGWVGSADELPDAAGNSMPVKRLEPRWALVDTDIVESIPWRGAQPSGS